MAIRARLLTFDDLAGIQCLIAHKIYRLSLWLPMCVCGTCISAFGRYGFGQPCRMSPWLSPGWYEKWNVICLCLVALLLFSFYFSLYIFIHFERSKRKTVIFVEAYRWCAAAAVLCCRRISHWDISIEKHSYIHISHSCDHSNMIMKPFPLLLLVDRFASESIRWNLNRMPKKFNSNVHECVVRCNRMMMISSSNGLGDARCARCRF